MGGSLAPAQTPAPARTFVRISEVVGGDRGLAGQGLPVHLQGTVTYSDTNDGRLFLQDSTGGIEVKGENLPLAGAAGQLVEVEGITGLADEEPAVLNAQLKVLGPAPPPHPLQESIRRLLAGHGQNRFVSISGVVRLVFEEKGKLIVQVVHEGSRIAAEVSRFDLATARQLPDAEVSLRGVCVWDLYPDGRKKKPRLLLASLDQIVVEKEAPDPTTLPVTALRSITELPRRDWGDHRRRVRGVVNFYFREWSDWYLYLQTGEDPLFVHLAEPTPVKQGDLIDVIGFPGEGTFRPALEDAQVTRVGQGALPAPLRLTPHIKNVLELDTRLVTVEGRLAAETTHNGYSKFTLRAAEDAGWLVTVWIADENASARDEPGERFPLHAKVRATGVLSVKFLQQGQAPELQVLAASPQSVTQIAAPPWSAREFLMVGVPLVVLLLVTIALIIAQRKHIRQQLAVKAALRRQERKLQDILDSMPAAVFVLDKDDRFTLLNKEWETMTGLSRATAIGKTRQEVFGPGAKPALESHWPMLWERPNPPENGEVVHVPDGKRAFLTQQFKLCDDGGNPYGLCGVASDISDLKRSEALLRESEKFAATGRMAARIAHEINNPLGGIRNAFELIKGALPPDAQTQRWAGMIEREIDRIASIVRRMFEFYGKQKHEPEDLRFDLLLSEVADLMRSKARQRNIALTVQPVSAPILGRQMAGSLVQVLYNLLSNAIDASPEGGEVHLGLEQKEEQVLLTVRDQGPGIPVEVQGKIFEPFFSTKTHHAGSGMGLGLAVSRSLVEAMGGRLDFVSREGAGTVFQVELPIILPALQIEELPPALAETDA